ncbi:hypothetical protein B0H16DRAFT_1515956 [Mycena metata]|uniref:HAM1-like N-terminal domain-containing protein n=1 Tax=Mycena metata TaxID=1033252 RepID=A0AAD7NQP7_9AGAR|nr:hypothetical protein B0H16DRAFT_1515956 [Mycena metata]
MGGFWSCCRRDKSPEKAPLLPKSRPSEEPPYSVFDKLADIIGAINTGKIPSQDQVSQLLQHALRSEFLRDPSNSIPSHGGPLSQQGVALVFEIKELVDSVLRMGLEKNYDNKIQDLLYQSSQSSDPLKVSGQLLVDGSPVQLDGGSSREISEDSGDFMRSLKTLSQLALTSSAFRMLVSDILTTTREVVAEAAIEVGEVASQVQAAAIDVAKAAELDNLTAEGLAGKAAESYSGIQQSVGHAHRNIGTLGDDSAQQVRDIVVGRVQEIILQAHRDPEHQAAISTIITLLRKYSGKLAAVAQSTDQPVTVDTQIDLSPPFYEAVIDFKVILERFASGRSLDPLLRLFKTTVADVLDAPGETGEELKRYFTDLGRWIERALAEPQFAASRLGTRNAEELYDAGRLLLESEANAQWAREVRALLAEAQSFAQSLEADATTQRLIKSLQSVLSALRALAKDLLSSGSSAQHKWRNELLKDVLGWLIPRILKSLRSLPMPRVEFQNGMFDIAIDALLLTSASASASLAPDHVWVQNWNEVKVDMTASASPETSSKTRIHIDGVRAAAHGIGYYFKYKGVIPYSDEGVLDVDIGKVDAVGEGLTMDLEIETTQEERDTPGAPLFRLIDVNVAVPGLAFVIAHSKHWILNNVLLQPLAAPAVRLVLQHILEQQIRSGVEWADRWISTVLVQSAQLNALRQYPGASPSLEDYWNAVLLTAQTPTSSSIEDESGPSVETHTEATFKGFIQTTTTLPDPDDAGTSAPPEETTILAVGGGAQLFPNKGGPYGVEEPTVAEVARGAVDEVQEAVTRSVGKTREVVEAAEDEAVRIRGEFERAEVRKRDRERFEQHRGGWKSRAFDLDTV